MPWALEVQQLNLQVTYSTGIIRCEHSLAEESRKSTPHNILTIGLQVNLDMEDPFPSWMQRSICHLLGKCPIY